LDASGKSTQADKLRQNFLSRGLSVHIRFHPSSDNWFGRKGRRFLLAEGKSAHLASAIFYIADVTRSILTTPWRRVHHIIYVRYLMGTAYLPSPLDRILYKFFEIVLPRPDVKLFLEVSPEEAYKRIIKNRTEKEMFESMDQLVKIGMKVKSLAELHDWTIVDADRREDEIEEFIASMVPSLK